MEPVPSQHVTFRSPGQKGFAVSFSPFSPQVLAYTASENFGIQGQGLLYILEVAPTTLHASTILKWHDCLFDVSWSEQEPDVVLTCAGDGSVQAWKLIPGQEGPVSVFKEHEKEVYAVDWNKARGSTFLSASWDGKVKLWDVHRPASVSTFCGHDHVVNDARWSPHVGDCFASVGVDAVLRIWNASGFSKEAFAFPTGTTELLACDWCKYNRNVIAVASTDASVRGWDLRNVTSPLFVLRGHDYAVKRVKFSPYHDNIIASSSYDMTTRIWNVQNTSVDGAFDCRILRHHTEFVYGLDFNLHVVNQLADCSWDERVEVMNLPL